MTPQVPLPQPGCTVVGVLLNDPAALAVRELARRVGRDVRRVHQDVQIPAELGLLERDQAGRVVCPYANMHMHMHMHVHLHHARAAA